MDTNQSDNRYLDAYHSDILVWKPITLVIPNRYQSIRQSYLDATYSDIPI
jgi:hypothetical protein